MFGLRLMGKLMILHRAGESILSTAVANDRTINFTA
jgi:hypothetical protein